VQDPHHRHRHHPPRLIRPLAAVWFALVALAAAPAAGAATPRYAALPSPFAFVAGAPPLAGGGTASGEGARHRIAAATTVYVAIDGTGRPFAMRATQTLDVRVLGDYLFTIGAPVLALRAAPGSESVPGLSNASILWAGFDPGRRTLAASVTLDPAAASAALPLRISVAGGHVTLRNATSTAVPAFEADTQTGPLRRYAEQLEHAVTAGRIPAPGAALVTSTPRAVSIRTFAPLHVAGTIGGRRVDTLLAATALTIAGQGEIQLTVEPVPPLALLRAAPGVTGRALLRRVTLALLGVARARQYDTYLGNPDPSGSNETTYLYRSAARPTRVAAPTPARGSHDGLVGTFLAVAGLLAALAVGVVAWSRS
jgi:hypothetical protein